MVGEYREDASNSYTFIDLVNCGFASSDEEFVLLSAVSNVLDSIESDIKDLSLLLSDIKGIAEIDKVKDRLEILEEKLF